MQIEELDPFPQDCNAFHHDVFNMGTTIGVVDRAFGNQAGNRIMLMCRNHPDEKCEFFIIVNEMTGKRHRITL